MSETESHFKVSAGSERGFGILFACVFLLVGLLPLISGDSVRWWSLILGTLVAMVAFAAPGLLRTPNRWWFRLGLALGTVVGTLTMVALFYMVVWPTGILVRLSGKDLLNAKPDPDHDSYWIPRKHVVGSMKNQF